MDFSRFKDSLGDWGAYMKPFIESPPCDEIYEYLKKRSLSGKVILPHHDNTFRAFKETPTKELKCIFFLQDPYPWIKDKKMVADGIAMSCSNTGVLQPSLSLFYDAIQENLETGSFRRNPDLKYLCNQGVMMLNTSLTVELERPNSHSNVRVLDKKVRLWEPFMKYFLEEVLSSFPGTILVFCGKESQYYSRFVNPLLHYIIEVEHPAAAAHGERSWKHENVFSRVNYIVEKNNGSYINWTDKKHKNE